MTVFFIVMLLVALNGAFVAAEFAIIAAPRGSIERRASAGDRLAALVFRIRQDPREQDRYIATAQLGITFASLGLGMYGEHALASWLMDVFSGLGAAAGAAAHTVASVTAITVLTYLHIVLGEMIPKTLALQHPEKVALAVSGPMVLLKRAVYPLVIGLNGIGNAVLRIFGVRRELTTSHFLTPEEIKYIVEESREGGMLRAGEVVKDMLKFGDITAGSAMRPRVKVCGLRLGAPAPEIAAEIRREAHTRYPVFGRDMDDIRGVVHMKAVLRILSAGGTLTHDDIRPVPFVREAVPLDEVLATMRQERTQMAVVTDEHGGTAGIVTLEDLFEEVVGEIEEHGSRGRKKV